MRRLSGSNRANMMDIANKYTALSGQMSQQMIDRGLGNTTIQGSMQRGVAADRAHETTRSRNMYSQLMANTQSQLGQAGLQAQQGMMNSMLQYVSAPYPDPSTYAQMAAAGGGGHGFQMGPPAMPGMSAPQAPTGGHIPAGLFSPSYTVEGGGGGGGMGIFGPQYQTGGYGAPPRPNVYSGGDGGGLWGPMYAAVQTAGQGMTDYLNNYADIPASAPGTFG
jgi:hypothetical protein